MDHAQSTTLMDVLNQVPDYRKRTGRLHRWITLLSLIAMALASAQRTPQALARWVHEQRDDLFAILPPTVAQLPSGATLRRALARRDVAALEAALTAFHPSPTPLGAPTPTPTPTSLQGVALDGKAVRGVGRDGHPCDLVALVQLGMRSCSGRSRSRTSGTSAVRFRHGSKGATCTGKS